MKENYYMWDIWLYSQKKYANVEDIKHLWRLITENPEDAYNIINNGLFCLSDSQKKSLEFWACECNRGCKISSEVLGQIGTSSEEVEKLIKESSII
jgi:hypothetical protein